MPEHEFFNCLRLSRKVSAHNCEFRTTNVHSLGSASTPKAFSLDTEETPKISSTNPSAD